MVVDFYIYLFVDTKINNNKEIYLYTVEFYFEDLGTICDPRSTWRAQNTIWPKKVQKSFLLWPNKENGYKSTIPLIGFEPNINKQKIETYQTYHNSSLFSDLPLNTSDLSMHLNIFFSSI